MDWESTQDAEWVAGNLFPFQVGGGHMGVSIGKKCKEREGEEPWDQEPRVNCGSSGCPPAHQTVPLLEGSTHFCSLQRNHGKGADSPVLGVGGRGKSK